MKDLLIDIYAIGFLISMSLQFFNIWAYQKKKEKHRDVKNNILVFSMVMALLSWVGVIVTFLAVLIILKKEKK